MNSYNSEIGWHPGLLAADWGSSSNLWIVYLILCSVSCPEGVCVLCFTPLCSIPRLWLVLLAQTSEWDVLLWGNQISLLAPEPPDCSQPSHFWVWSFFTFVAKVWSYDLASRFEHSFPRLQVLLVLKSIFMDQQDSSKTRGTCYTCIHRNLSSIPSTIQSHSTAKFSPGGPQHCWVWEELCHWPWLWTV